MAATVNETLPSPCPLVAPTETQLASADTDQVQSRVVAIVKVPDAPDGGADCIELVTWTWHLVPDGPLRATEDDVHAAARAATIPRLAAVSP